VYQKHGSTWPPTEEALAGEFVEYFKLQTLVNLAELQEICDRLGIIFRIEQLPESLRGINYRYQEKREIVISDSQLLTKEHTTLHELREVIEYEFRDLRTPVCTTEDKEERADSFAVSVRMCAFGKEIPGLMEHVDSIESKWPRRAAYCLLFVFIAIYVLGLTLTPHLEDIVEEKRTKRPRPLK
jgi:hypothetical protein